MVILKWAQQSLEPIGINGIHMCTDNDDELTLRFFDPMVERASESKFFRGEFSRPALQMTRQLKRSNRLSLSRPGSRPHP